MMIGSTFEYLAVNNENRLLKVGTANQQQQQQHQSQLLKETSINKRTQAKTTNNVSSKKPIIPPTTSEPPLNSSVLIENPSATSSSSTTESCPDDNETNSSTSPTTRQRSNKICKANSLNLKQIYANLMDIDDQLNRPLTNDYFFTENYMFESMPVPAVPTVVTHPKLGAILVNTNSPKGGGGCLKTTNNRVIEFNEWSDGLNEWHPNHPYPSFKTYINGYARRKNNKKNNDLADFDEATGLFLPNFNFNKQQPQKENIQNKTVTQNTHNQLHRYIEYRIYKPIHS
jgi:hypothetical protein